MTQEISNKVNTNQTYRLSVQISLNGLSFLMQDQKGEVIHFSKKEMVDGDNPEEVLGFLSAFVEKHNIKKAAVTLIYATKFATLVPLPLFNAEKPSEYLKFNTKILPNDFVSFDTIEANDLAIVYVPYINVNNYIFDRFGDFKYYHLHTLLIKLLLQRQKHQNKNQCYIHVQGNQFECYLFKAGKLVLCNSYNFKTPEDFVYFILFNFEQLQLNPNEDTLTLLGDIDESDANYKLAYTYVRNIDFLAANLVTLEQELEHQQVALKILL